jgi:hypothetical protein
LLEAQWIHDLAPTVNVQRGEPSNTRRISSRYVRDVVVVLPSLDADSVELIAARTSGTTMILRTFRDGRQLAVDADRLWIFFEGRKTLAGLAPDQRALAPIVFSWLAFHGAKATRFEVGDLVSADDLRVRLSVALSSPQLFSERLVIQNSRT